MKCLFVLSSLVLTTVLGYQHPSIQYRVTQNTHRHASPFGVAASVGLDIPGDPMDSDQQAFLSDPQAFCLTRSLEYGPIFKTGAFGGTTFVGDATALRQAARVDLASDVMGAPFANFPDSREQALFASIEEEFNSECYDCIFNWIPRYKEAGFSTFRFEDFIDGRVRKMMRSARELVLRAAAPALFGMSYQQFWQQLELDGPSRLVDLYSAHAAASRGSDTDKGGALPFGLNFPAIMGKGGTSALIDALEPWARSKGVPAETAVAELTASVEQTAALLCNMLAAAQSHPTVSSELANEQANILKGLSPKAPVTTEVLEKMPVLDAFTSEVLRTAPPSRPFRCELSQPLTIGEISVPAGTLIAPEPLVAAYQSKSHPNPDRFDISRFASRDETPPTLCFGGPIREAHCAGDDLARDIAKSSFVQLRRMFEDVRLAAQPAPIAGGYPLRSLSETTEVLLKPKMFYELERGVKQLRF